MTGDDDLGQDASKNETNTKLNTINMNKINKKLKRKHRINKIKVFRVKNSWGANGAPQTQTTY